MDGGGIDVQSRSRGADTRHVRRVRAITLLSLTSLLLAAPLAEARSPRPYVKSVSPLRASVGEQMTITGFYFTPGYAENVVVFVARDGRVSYVRSEHSTKRKMTVIVPKKVERLLKVVNGVRVPTKFRIKVISTRMSRLATGALSAPVIGPDVGGDCDSDGIPNPTDTDDDSDLLPDSVEAAARTNPCVWDSDGDKLLDGWEYLSALDLNKSALPYPGKRPFPNALDPADANTDYDGDGLPAWAEHTMWWFGGRGTPLSYSDGDQTTQPEAVNETNWWNDLGYPSGELSDDERDFDGDGLGNVLEMSSFYFKPWEGFFPGVIRPEFLDRDTDGDGLRDGDDDQDHDDVANIDEFIAGTWAMNPCDPLGRESRTCPRWFDPEAMPEKPDHLCFSPTVFGSPGGVVGFEYEFDPTKPIPDDVELCEQRQAPSF